MTDPVQSLRSSTYPIGLVSPLLLLHCSLTVQLHGIAIPVSEFWHLFIFSVWISILGSPIMWVKTNLHNVFLVWTDQWKCCIYISYKCQYFTSISFEMAASTLKPLPHIYSPDMLWDLLVSATWVSVFVVLGTRIKSKDSPLCWFLM